MMKWSGMACILTCTLGMVGCGEDVGTDSNGTLAQASPVSTPASTTTAPPAPPTDSGTSSNTSGQPSNPVQPSQAPPPTKTLTATYTVTQIDDGTSDFSQATGLNASNDVVGSVFGLNPNGNTQAFYWDGTTQHITILPSVNDANDIEATGINDSGAIIGLTFTSLAPGKQGNPWSPVLWPNAGTSAPPPVLTDPSNLIRHINDNGLLAGQDSNNRAATWSL